MEGRSPMHAGVPKLKRSDHPAGTGLSGGEGQSLGSSLGPVLREICQGRLGEIDWFRSTWQRGGAATGFATWTFQNGQAVEVMIKLPVGPSEQSWTMRLGAVEPEDWSSSESEALPTPRVVASGEALGGYDLSWLIMERFRGHPLISDLTKACGLHLAQTTAEFQDQTLRLSPVHGSSAECHYRTLWSQSLVSLDSGSFEHEERWRSQLGKIDRRLEGLIERWESRPLTSWCHGDVHPANAMWRQCKDGKKRSVLIDLALVHRGHWVEDGLYLERQFWGHDDALGGVEPVEALARARAQIGLGLDGDYYELSRIRRLLLACAAPALLGREGSHRYLKRALDILETDGKPYVPDW